MCAHVPSAGTWQTQGVPEDPPSCQGLEHGQRDSSVLELVDQEQIIVPLNPAFYSQRPDSLER
jgi:hypothetical protein